MIPKVIHWCFLTNPYPALVDKCLQTWKKFCPGYLIKRWDMGNVDFSTMPKWCKVAYDNKLYAFVADYVRVNAIYEEGGIYLDSDVCICEHDPFKEYENERLWIPMENVFTPRIIEYKYKKYKHGVGVNPVFYGAEAGHPYFRDLLKRYDELPDDYAEAASKYFNSVPIAPAVWSSVMEEYGLKYQNKEQHLTEGIHVLSDEKFKHLGLSGDRKGLSAIHLACNSWVRCKKLY